MSAIEFRSVFLVGMTLLITACGGGSDGPKDSDGDGVSDLQDAFPTNPSETTDSDGDGIGNNADALQIPLLLKLVILGFILRKETGLISKSSLVGHSKPDLIL